METKRILKKTGKIAVNVVLCIFIAVSLVSLFLTIIAKKGADDAATVFGMQMRIVQSPSMEKCDVTDVSGFEIKDIPTRSMVFIDTVPEDPERAEEWYADLKVGDVLTFKYVYVKQETITHRIISIEEKATGGYLIELAGDNKNDESGVLTQKIDTSASNSPNYVIGKVTGQNYALGVFLTALRSPVGLICIVIVPSLIIVILEIVRIVNTLTSEKKKKEKEAQSEVDELKRRLAELEAAQSNGDSTHENSGTPGNGAES